MARRRVLGVGLVIARALGLLMVALAIVSLPELRIFTGRLAGIRKHSHGGPPSIRGNRLARWCRNLPALL